ncbi:MAG: BLUF domain-containing protein [Burkholderiaceae bacterium]
MPDSRDQTAGNASHTLVYISRSQVQGDIMRELVQIEAQACKHNTAHHIRGALIYMGGFFMQWLEGPLPALQTLNERLQRDPRHSDYHVLLFDAHEPVLADDWMVCVAKRTETAEDVRARADAVVLRSRSGGWSAADLVRGLVKPADAPNNQREAGPFRYTRVCVVATNSIWPSALVRHVADTAQIKRISRTWFNAPAVPDEAALCEYVDIPLRKGTHMRLSCISGWMVQSSLFELLNQQTQVLAMLFRSASPAETLAFAQKILATASMRSIQPVVIGVFTPKSTLSAERFRAYAQEQGFTAQVVFSHLAEPSAVWDEIRAAAERFFVQHEWAVSAASAETVFSPRAAPGKVGAAPAIAAQPVVAVKPVAVTTPAPASPPALAQTLQRIFSSQGAVQSWAAWSQDNHHLVAASTPEQAPADLLQALAHMRSQQAPGAPLEFTCSHGGGTFEWLALLSVPGSGGDLWVRVVLRDADLNMGMVQYLAGQWKDALAQADAT